MISRLPGLRQLPQAAGPILEDTVLFDSWRGEFSDNPRAISEELHRRALRVAVGRAEHVVARIAGLEDLAREAEGLAHDRGAEAVR